MNNFKILIFTAFWQRPKISEAYWLGIERLRKSFNIKTFAILSDADNVMLAKKYKSDYQFFYENKPIGKKMNMAMVEAMKIDFDLLIQLGSDDMLTDNALKNMCLYYTAGVKFFGLNKVAMYDSKTKTAGTYFYGNVFGAGRCIAREILMKLCRGEKIQILESFAGPDIHFGKGAIVDMPMVQASKLVNSGLAKYINRESTDNLFWQDIDNMGLDMRSESKIEDIGYVAVPILFDEPQTYAIKSDDNIWKFEQFNYESYPVDKIFANLSEDEINHLQQL